jgi:hypothetical protein
MKKKAANLRIPPKYVDKTTGLEKPKNAAHLLIQDSILSSVPEFQTGQ